MKRILTLMALMVMLVTSSFAATPDYLRFYLPKALISLTTNISFNVVGTLDYTPKLEYSVDGTTWKDYTFDTSLPITNSTTKDVGVYFRAKVTLDSHFNAIGKNATFSQDAENYIQFTSDGTICADGNIMSLLDASCEQTSVPDYAFKYLFKDCKYLKTAPSLPATTLGESCYGSMFVRTGISEAPVLPATTIVEDCYGYMFYQCTSLKTAPSLPALTLADMCYRDMFGGCTALTTAPDLPATTLSTLCYVRMFQGCTSLVDAPELPAKTLATTCYWHMFYGCTKLNNVSVAFTDWNTAGESTTDWLNGVAETGTFYCPADLDVSTRGASTFPEGWNNANPLCFTAEEAGAQITMSCAEGMTSVPSMQYSTDGSTWTDYTIGTSSSLKYITLTSVGDKVYFRAKDKNATFCENNHDGSVKGIRFYILGGKIAASGNVMSLLDKTCQQTSVPDHAFSGLFADCKLLTTAPELPATTLGEFCYDGMFSDCTGLTQAPALPATTMTPCCYYGMFRNCTSLTSAPALPAKTLPLYCYREMFSGCTNLNSVTVGFTDWNTNLKPTCDWLSGVAETGMFICPDDLDVSTRGTSTVPVGWNYQKPLVITAEAANVNISFNKIGTFKKEPTIKYTTDATTWQTYEYGKDITLANVGDKAYFKADGTNATFSEQKLPNEGDTGADPVYINFSASDKVAASGNIMSLLDETCSQTSVPRHAFTGLFAGCTTLTSAPDLPATELYEYCYQNMFHGCTSLTTAPALPASDVASHAYRGMFSGCTNLNSVTVNFTTWPDESTMKNWLSGVAETGIFYCPPTLADPSVRGASTVPEGWSMPRPLCFTSEQSNADITLTCEGTLTTVPSLEYTTDCVSWTDYTVGNAITLANQGDKVYFRAKDKNATFSTDDQNYMKFNITSVDENGFYNGNARVAASGNIMSLLDKTCAQNAVPNGAFINLFAGCDKYLTSAPALPATTLGEECYIGMFDGCSNLVTAPVLPATTLSRACYMKMFNFCSSLETAPTLPATTMANSCYFGMFQGCSGLTQAPELKSTTLATACYSFMFDGCSSLETAPELPATELAEDCYNCMFLGCSALTRAPHLPAKTLVARCYNCMFLTCDKLNYVSVEFTDWNENAGATTVWLSGVASTGNFYGPADLDETIFDATHIPEGWTVGTYGDSKVTANSINLSRLIDALGNGEYSSKFDYDEDGDLDLDDVEAMKCKILGMTYCPTVEIGGVKWATKNLGASLEYEYGDYYAWGETYSYVMQKEPFTWTNYCDSETFTEWDPAPYDATTKILKPEYDAAHVQWGGDWHMPTQADFEALLTACGCTDFSDITINNGNTSNWPTEQGIYRMRTAEGSNMSCLLFIDDNGHQLMLPAGGYMDDSTSNKENIFRDGDFCNYWTSTCSESDTSDANIFFGDATGESKTYIGSTFRYQGYLIRPVKK